MFSETKSRETSRLTNMCFVIYLDCHIAKTNKQTNKDGVRATTAQLYPGRDTFEFDQGHVTKNQPITVLILLSESLSIQQELLFLSIPGS